MRKTWTPAELTQLQTLKSTGASAREMAEILGRTIKAVQVQLERIPVVEQTPQERAGIEYWKDKATQLQRRIDDSTKQETATGILVEQVRELAPVAYAPAPFIEIQHKRGESSPQTAMLMLSDTHVGALVRPEQTLDFGGYNFDIFRRRLKRLENSVASILTDHTSTAVEELVVPLLGDCIDGALQHSAECGQVNPLFNQFYGAGHAIAQFLRNLSTMVPSIRVHTCVGNHPRWGTQKKMPTKNRFSNLDFFLYAYIEALLVEQPRIKFHLNQQPFAEFGVYNWRFLAAHGDHLRGGDKALGIPAHAIGRNISAAAQLRLKAQKPGINYYLLGHLHRPMELPHAGGEILVNGGFIGVDEYGTMENFTACDPMQKFFFVHPKHGRAACYSLNLKFADAMGPAPYSIPGNFSLQ